MARRTGPRERYGLGTPELKRAAAGSVYRVPVVRGPDFEALQEGGPGVDADSSVLLDAEGCCGGPRAGFSVEVAGIDAWGTCH
jgi:hypothetical protein